MFCYSVSCRFEGNREDVASMWLDWLVPGHLNDVLAVGALSAEVVELDDDVPHYRICYRFPSREEFEEYLKNHADRLRAEGAKRFPEELGLKFRRDSGPLIASICKTKA